jgi:hypothetical protein
MYTVSHTPTSENEKEIQRLDGSSGTTQFWVPTAANCQTLTGCVKVSHAVGHERGSRHLFHYIMSLLWVLMAFRVDM